MIMRYLFGVLLIIFATQVYAEEGGAGPELQLAQPPSHIKGIESIKRGAKFFATNCMSCHTLKYLRYDNIAKEAGITLDKMPLKVVDWPYGVRPPDLSLEADVRGVDWIYTYLHSFYKDPSRPTGTNNLLVKDTAMANMVAPYQGEQVLVKNPMPDILNQVQWYDLVELTRQGSMTPEEFDNTIADVVNFLQYAAQPFQAEQHKIGTFVLIFLAILFVLMVLLKREYWKDVKKHKTEE